MVNYEHRNQTDIKCEEKWLISKDGCSVSVVVSELRAEMTDHLGQSGSREELGMPARLGWATWSGPRCRSAAVRSAGLPDHGQETGAGWEAFGAGEDALTSRYEGKCRAYCHPWLCTGTTNIR